jgi:hypothetical protein
LWDAVSDIDPIFSPDSRSLLVVQDGQMRLLNARTGEPIRDLKTPFVPSAPYYAFSPDGDALYSSNTTDKFFDGGCAKTAWAQEFSLPFNLPLGERRGARRWKRCCFVQRGPPERKLSPANIMETTLSMIHITDRAAQEVHGLWSARTSPTPCFACS